MNKKVNIDKEAIVILKDQAESRSKVYMLLSIFYMQRPEEDFMNKIMRDNFTKTLVNILSKEKNETQHGLKLFADFITTSKSLPIMKIAEMVTIDFTKLFRGIKKGYGPPPPYESIWRGENRVMGEYTQDVLNYYLTTGIGMDLKGEVPDYIGLELKFMSILCYKEKEEWELHNIQQALNYLRFEQKLMNEHLKEWIPKFCEYMEKEANTDFYRGIAILTSKFLENDGETITEIFEFVKRDH